MSYSELLEKKRMLDARIKAQLAKPHDDDWESDMYELECDNWALNKEFIATGSNVPVTQG